MARSKFSFWSRLFGITAVLGMVWATAGCGDEPDVVPVSGRVTVDGEPLRSRGGVVNFVPDKAKGNTTTLEPAGVLDEDGNFTVYYATKKKGAPTGWYKVQVTAMPPGDQPFSMPGSKGRGPKPPKPLFNWRFTRAADSGLAVEVVRNPAPGAYDLKLTR